MHLLKVYSTWRRVSWSISVWKLNRLECVKWRESFVWIDFYLSMKTFLCSFEIIWMISLTNQLFFFSLRIFSFANWIARWFFVEQWSKNSSKIFHRNHTNEFVLRERPTEIFPSLTIFLFDRSIEEEISSKMKWVFIVNWEKINDQHFFLSINFHCAKFFFCKKKNSRIKSNVKFSIIFSFFIFF